jgi:hypothetical protein
VGQPETALHQPESLMHAPRDPSPDWLHIDPGVAPLRGHARLVPLTRGA